MPKFRVVLAIQQRDADYAWYSGKLSQSLLETADPAKATEWFYAVYDLIQAFVLFAAKIK